MNLDILGKTQIKKLIGKSVRAEFNKIYSYLDKLNQRIMRLEEEFKVRRYLKQEKEK